MDESDLPGVEAEGGIRGIEGLGRAQFLIGEVDGIADNGESELPEMNADLVGSAGEGTGFEQGGSIGEMVEEIELGAGGESSFEIDLA